MTKTISKILYYTGIPVIILTSFFFFSSRFYPLLNSDDAVTILMTHWFHLPDDLYYWGQNRYGSLLPFIGQFFYRILHLSPVMTESVTHYIILLAGFLSFITLLKSKKSKFLFAIIWFFPPFHFIDLIRNVPGIQYSLLAVVILLVTSYQNKSLRLNQIQQVIVFAGIILVAILAVWVSDLAVVSFIILMILLWLYPNPPSLPNGLRMQPNSSSNVPDQWIQPFSAFTDLLKIRLKQIPSLRYRKETYILAFGLFIGFLFIWFAKTQAIRMDTYHEKIFNTPENLLRACFMLKDSMVANLTFRGDNLFTTIYMWGIILLIFFFIITLKKNTISANTKLWIVFFLADGLALLVVILLSRWAFLNGIPRRYFTGIYLVAWLAFLICIDQYPASGLKTGLFVFSFLTVLIGSVSTFYYMRYTRPKHFKPMIEVVGEFQSLGKIGLLAEYWNSYIVSCADPNQIKATPHDKCLVRNPSLVDSVFAQPRLFVIRDMWLDQFPDTLHQFGRKLIRKGTFFFIGNCCVNEYQEVSKHGL